MESTSGRSVATCISFSTATDSAIFYIRRYRKRLCLYNNPLIMRLSRACEKQSRPPPFLVSSRSRLAPPLAPLSAPLPPIANPIITSVSILSLKCYSDFPRAGNGGGRQSSLVEPPANSRAPMVASRLLLSSPFLLPLLLLLLLYFSSPSTSPLPHPLSPAPLLLLLFLFLLFFLQILLFLLRSPPPASLLFPHLSFSSSSSLGKQRRFRKRIFLT